MAENDREIVGTRKVTAERRVVLLPDGAADEWGEVYGSLLRGLAKKGVWIGIVGGGSECYGGIEGVKRFDCPACDMPFFGKRNVGLLVEQLRQFGPQVIHCLSANRAKIGSLLSSGLSVPYVVNQNDIGGFVQKAKISLRRCDRIVVPCESIYESLSNEGDRVRVVKPGVEVSGAVSFEGRGRLSTILVYRDFERASDFQPLLSAARHLALDGFEFILVLTGRGGAEHQIREMVDELGLLQIVTISPYPKPSFRVLSASDVFAVIQPEKRFNVILLEAMGRGVTAAGCLGGVDDLMREIPKEGIFDADDELSIHRCLVDILSRPTEARQRATKMREFIRMNYSVEEMVAGYLRVYAEIV